MLKGNFLIGLYQASFKALIIKSYERLEKGVYILYSNIVTGWEKKGGKVVGIYAPIQYIELKSGLPKKDYIPDKYQLVYLNEHPYYKFNTLSNIFQIIKMVLGVNMDFKMIDKTNLH